MGIKMINSDQKKNLILIVLFALALSSTKVSGDSITTGIGCTFTPDHTDSLEIPFGGSYSQINSINIFSNKATIGAAPGQGYAVNGYGVWGLGGPSAVPYDGNKFYGGNGISISFELVFTSPVISFGGFFAYNNGGTPVTFQFYDSSDSLIGSRSFSYNAASRGGNMDYAGFCSTNGSPIIKKITFRGDFIVMDYFTMLTGPPDVTTNAITSSALTTGVFTIISNNKCLYPPNKNIKKCFSLKDLFGHIPSKPYSFSCDKLECNDEIRSNCVKNNKPRCDIDYVKERVCVSTETCSKLTNSMKTKCILNYDIQLKEESGTGYLFKTNINIPNNRYSKDTTNCINNS